MFSLCPEDAAGGPIERYLQAVHPEDRHHVQEAITEALHSPGGQYEMDYRLVQSDSSVRWVTGREKVERNAEGKAIHFPGVVIDITERKRAEARVTYQKRLLEALTESVLDAIQIVSPEGKLMHFNERFLEMWRFPTDVIAMRSDSAALQWAAHQTADPAGFLARVAAIHANPDRSIREELTMRDGRVYERFGSSIRSGNARLGWVWTFRDVTQARAAEGALREKEAFVRLLLDSAADGFYGVDREGVTTFCNAAFLRMLGFKREEEAIGKKLHGVIHHSHPDGKTYANPSSAVWGSGKKSFPLGAFGFEQSLLGGGWFEAM